MFQHLGQEIIHNFYSTQKIGSWKTYSWWCQSPPLRQPLQMWDNWSNYIATVCWYSAGPKNHWSSVFTWFHAQSGWRLFILFFFMTVFKENNLFLSNMHNWQQIIREMVICLTRFLHPPITANDLLSCGEIFSNYIYICLLVPVCSNYLNLDFIDKWSLDNNILQIWKEIKFRILVNLESIIFVLVAPLSINTL